MRRRVLAAAASLLLLACLCSCSPAAGSRARDGSGGGGANDAHAPAAPGARPGAAARAGPDAPAAAAAPRPPFAATSPRAVPGLAIIGTAKAGTTDMYSLITKTSRQAAGAKRMKEAKLLVEEGGPPLAPGSASFHAYLLRVGAACAPAADPRRGDSAARYAACVDGLARQPAGALPLSVDATPMYLAVPRAADALASLSRDTKVLVLLRHPLERAESLYNHRAHTEARRVLPARVSNVSLSAWGERFLAWLDAAPGARRDLARLAGARDLDAAAALYRELVAPGGANLLGLPPGPLTFGAYNRNGSVERNIFGSALYGPALSAWRAAFGFQPGRLMVVDAHAFFADRLGVLDAVQRFLHGRGLSAAERRIAARTGVANARRARGIRLPGAALEGRARRELAAFYEPFTESLLTRVLPALRAEGAHVVGFEGPPWTRADV